LKNQTTLDIELADVGRTRAFGKAIADSIQGNAILALKGPLGAGKTTLVQGIGEALGVEEIINSPTFTMLNEYHSGRLPLYHLDLYRIKDDPATAAALGGRSLDLLRAELDEFITHPGVILIEWAEHIEEFLPADHASIEIDYACEAEGARRARLKALGSNSQRILDDVSANFC
jgi:tRNA threonylcarbamoyladenosine biosynthesis protein TsaE